MASVDHASSNDFIVDSDGVANRMTVAMDPVCRPIGWVTVSCFKFWDIEVNCFWWALRDPAHSVEDDRRHSV